jgi:hypothetical protein
MWLQIAWMLFSWLYSYQDLLSSYHNHDDMELSCTHKAHFIRNKLKSTSLQRDYTHDLQIRSEILFTNAPSNPKSDFMTSCERGPLGGHNWVASGWWVEFDQWPLPDIIGTWERFCQIVRNFVQFLVDPTMFYILVTCIWKKS